MSLYRNPTWHSARVFPQDVRHAFDRFFAPESQGQGESAAAAAGQWAPHVDIREDEHRFVILADIPGVDPALIDVSMDKGVLTIKGERQAEAPVQGSRFNRVERARGAFHRRFALPDTADAEGITATGRHGVLEISIPKKAQAAPRRIAINAG
ncbi:heat-shock protein Hsp20 [Frateuria sp. Soil773]|uniref:Hsp20/alpha crystallin family protein n=1 Tax=Frateuria sp. Soil773 TaxID=1736407 RepID=UPI00070221B3|nr:Hsp20/alpha crystallin family protein [Frateuria sp. Soil773]KRE90606.1 heat-shock protein Hsp20 [Frateuria sp. Soil773]